MMSDTSKREEQRSDGLTATLRTEAASSFQNEGLPRSVLFQTVSKAFLIVLFLWPVGGVAQACRSVGSLVAVPRPTLREVTQVAAESVSRHSISDGSTYQPVVLDVTHPNRITTVSVAPIARPS